MSDLLDLKTARMRIAELEQQVLTLSTRLEDFDPSSGSNRRGAPAVRSKFRPVEPAACLRVSPCLRSSATERIGEDCLTRTWSGRWTIDPLVSPALLQSKQGWLEQHFTPAALQCEVADPFLLAPTWSHHVTVAQSQFVTSRLKGIRDAVWLMVGTSIDHGIVYEGAAK
jgi:hypothetical protein